jgi:hypothetical protein
VPNRRGVAERRAELGDHLSAVGHQDHLARADFPDVRTEAALQLAQVDVPHGAKVAPRGDEIEVCGTPEGAGDRYRFQSASELWSATASKSRSIVRSVSAWRMQSCASTASIVPTWAPRRRHRLRSDAAST